MIISHCSKLDFVTVVRPVLPGFKVTSNFFAYICSRTLCQLYGIRRSSEPGIVCLRPPDEPNILYLRHKFPNIPIPCALYTIWNHSWIPSTPWGPRQCKHSGENKFLIALFLCVLRGPLEGVGGDPMRWGLVSSVSVWGGEPGRRSWVSKSLRAFANPCVISAIERPLKTNLLFSHQLRERASGTYIWTYWERNTS